MFRRVAEPDRTAKQEYRSGWSLLFTAVVFLYGLAAAAGPRF